MRRPSWMTAVAAIAAVAANGQIDPARLTPRTAGFGATTGAAAMRSIQLQLRLQF